MVSRNKQAKAPISSHPAFPAIVALWFAALLGIGSLIVPATLIERFHTIAGLPEIQSATGPLAGFPAKPAIALAGSVLGAGFGLLLARLIAAARAGRPGVAAGKGHLRGGKQPISALEELGAQSLDQPVDDDAEQYADPESLAAGAGEGAGDSAADADDFKTIEPPQDACEQAGIVSSEAGSEGAPDRQAHAQNPVIGLTAEQLISRPLEELGIVQLIERFALSLQHRPASALRGTRGERENAPAAADFPAALRPIEIALDDDGFFDDGSCQDEGVGSLLHLRTTAAGPRHNRLLPESGAPVVVPAAESAGSGDHAARDPERPLRAALEQLQKMSGVG